MPGIIGFPQLDPGHNFGGSPPAEEPKPADKPAPMPTTPDPALEEYDDRQEARIDYNHRPSPDMPPSNNPVFNKEKATEHVEHVRKSRESARNKQSKSSDTVVPDDLPAETKPDIDMFEFPPLAGGEESMAPDSWQNYTPLTQLQEEEVNHLLSVETDSLAREVLITLKRDGVPPKREWPDFMAQYALWSWDSESDARAWATLAKIAESDWDEWLGHADSLLVEGVAQDQANDWIEGVVIIHPETGETLLDVTGVVGVDGSQYVGLQDTDVEALKGLDLIFVHNHTEEVGASDEDLESAFDAGAEVLIVITPSGREQVYVRGRGQMVLVRDEQASYEIAPPTAVERREVRERSEKQAAVYEVDSPEFIFRQGEPGLRDRLVDVALELNLHSEPTALTESELINIILNLTNNNDLHAFHKAAAVFSSQDETREIYPGDLLELLTGAFPYWKTAEMTGVDPARLAQMVLWENPKWFKALEKLDYRLSKSVGVSSFGVAQIKVGTAIDMLKSYPDKFLDFGPVVSAIKGGENQSWDEDKVGQALFYNEEFSIRVAGVYLMDFESRLQPYLRQLGVVVSDRHIDDPHISVHDLRLLAVVGYNQGWGGALAKLKGLYDTQGARAVVDGIRRTLGSNHVEGVLSMENEALERYGLLYGEYRHEE